MATTGMALEYWYVVVNKTYHNKNWKVNDKIYCDRRTFTKYKDKKSLFYIYFGKVDCIDKESLRIAIYNKKIISFLSKDGINFRWFYSRWE